MSGDLRLRDGIAVDLGGTKTGAARIRNGEVIRHQEVPTNSMGDLGDQIRAVSELLAELDLSAADALGFAFAGRIDADGNWHAVNKTTLSKIESVPLRQRLMEQFGREVRVMNDATAAAIGEYLAGAGKGCRSVGYLTVSTGVGGGFVLDGRPLVSASGLAGHVGFTTSRESDASDGSGRFGTVESVAGGRAIARQAAEAGHTDLDARAVFEAHLGGDEWATEIVGRSARAVAELSANIKSLLDPDVIVLGGSIGLAEGYLELVQAALAQEPDLFRPALKRSTLGPHAALIGVLAA